MREVILTTTASVPGHDVDRILDVIEATSAASPSVVSDFFASIIDFTGGTNTAFGNPVKTVFEDVRRRLREAAAEIGADAVVGIDFEVTEFSKSGAIVAIGVGTAVTLRRQEPER